MGVQRVGRRLLFGAERMWDFKDNDVEEVLSDVVVYIGRDILWG